VTRTRNAIVTIRSANRCQCDPAASSLLWCVLTDANSGRRSPGGARSAVAQHDPPDRPAADALDADQQLHPARGRHSSHGGRAWQAVPGSGCHLPALTAPRMMPKWPEPQRHRRGSGSTAHRRLHWLPAPAGRAGRYAGRRDTRPTRCSRAGWIAASAEHPSSLSPAPFRTLEQCAHLGIGLGIGRRIRPRASPASGWLL